MSAKVETLQAPRTGRSILLATSVASLVMLTIAVVAISLDRDQGGQGETTFVGRHVVNTPSELSAQIGGGRPKTVAGGTLANTPTELSGWIRHKFVGDKLGTNTPTELSGGLIGDGLPAEFYDRHQRG
jgi:hypothetical protein